MVLFSEKKVHVEIRQPETSTTFEIMMKARIEDGVVYSPYPGCEIPDTSLYSVVKEYLQKFPEGLAMVSKQLSSVRRHLMGLHSQCIFSVACLGGPQDIVIYTNHQ